MCDDCEDTSTSDTSCDTSDDTSSESTCDTSDSSSELPDDSGDLSTDGSEELPDDNYSEDNDVSGGDEEISDSDSDDGSEELPEDGGDEVTDDGSEELPEDGGDEVTDDGSEELPEDSGDEVVDDGSDELPDDSGDEVTDDGSDELPDDSGDEVTDDGSDEITNDSLEESSGGGTDEISEDSMDEVVDDSSDNVTDNGMDEFPDDGSDGLPEDEGDEASDEGSEALPDESVDEVSDDGSDELPEDEGDEAPDDGADELSDENSDEITGDGLNGLSDDSSDDFTDDGSDELPNESSDEITDDGSDEFLNDGLGELSDASDKSNISGVDINGTIDDDLSGDIPNVIKGNDKELFGFGKSKKNDLALGQNDFDHSQAAQELRDIGVKNVDLRECNPEYQQEVVDAVKDMYNQYPELKDQVRDIKCYKMDNDHTFASYGPTKYGEEFGGQLNLNSTHFGSDGFRDELSSQSDEGWLTPNASPQSIVSHELGHGLHLDMCAKDSGLAYGSVPTKNGYTQMINQYADNVHASDIVDQACRDCNLDPLNPYTPYYMQNELSKYGASDKGEAFAEGIAEANTSSNPRPLATAINNRYLEYRNKKGVQL